MEKDYKKIILGCICAIALFFALMGVIQLASNAGSILAFKSNIQYHDTEFVKYTAYACLYAAIISGVGTILFLIDLLLKRNIIFDIILIIYELAAVIALIIISSMIYSEVPLESDASARLQEFSLFSSTLGVFIQQIATLAVFLFIRVYQKVITPAKGVSDKRNKI